MKLRKIRRDVATYTGLVMCVVELLWILIADTKLSIEATWLFVILCPVVAGGLAMISSYTLGNAESKAWFPLDLGAFFIGGIFVVFYPQAMDNKKFADSINLFLEYEEQDLLPFHNIALIVGLVGFAILFICLVIDVILYFVLDRKNKI